MTIKEKKNKDTNNKKKLLEKNVIEKAYKIIEKNENKISFFIFDSHGSVIKTDKQKYSGWKVKSK